MKNEAARSACKEEKAEDGDREDYRDYAEEVKHLFGKAAEEPQEDEGHEDQEEENQQDCEEHAEDIGEELIVWSINVTSLNTTKEILAETDAHIVLIQEHSCTNAQLAKCKKELRKSGWNLHASPTTQGAKGSGVACMVKMPIIAVPWRATSQAFKELHNIGRCGIYECEVGGDKIVLVNVYGATGGHQDTDAAQKTDYIMAAVQEEMEMKDMKGARIYLCGDINADVEDIPVMHDLVSNQGWQDLGERAAIWGRQPCEPTCKAPNAMQENRRDYILSNPEGFPKVLDYQVIRCDNFSVHQPIQMKLRVKDLKVEKDILYKPLDAKERFDEKIEKMYEENQSCQHYENEVEHKTKEQIRKEELQKILPIIRIQNESRKTAKSRSVSVISGKKTYWICTSFNTLLQLLC